MGRSAVRREPGRERAIGRLAFLLSFDCRRHFDVAVSTAGFEASTFRSRDGPMRRCDLFGTLIRSSIGHFAGGRLPGDADQQGDHGTSNCIYTVLDGLEICSMDKCLPPLNGNRAAIFASWQTFSVARWL